MAPSPLLLLRPLVGLLHVAAPTGCPPSPLRTVPLLRVPLLIISRPATILSHSALSSAKATVDRNRRCLHSQFPRHTLRGPTWLAARPSLPPSLPPPHRRHGTAFAPSDAPPSRLPQALLPLPFAAEPLQRLIKPIAPSSASDPLPALRTVATEVRASSASPASHRRHFPTPLLMHFLISAALRARL